MKDDYELEIFKHSKKGYRWHFMINGDIKYISPEWFDSAEQAEQDARFLLENTWILGEKVINKEN